MKRLDLFGFLKNRYNALMPQRNVVRQFVPESIYHVYNRGVEKRQIFMDEQDHGVFLNRLKQLLADPDELKGENTTEHLQSFYGTVELIAFCLMPNHFHLLLYQHDERSISEFMRALSTSYTMYFNKRHNRVGSLFQGTYKAKLIDSDQYWQHISRYIHLNPEVLGVNIENYRYSSLRYYSKNLNTSWVSPDRVLNEFNDFEDYLSFIHIFSGKLQTLNDELSLN